MVGSYADITINGQTRKYYVRRANKNAMFKRAQFVQNSEINNAEISDTQICELCLNPNLGNVFCLSLYNSCDDYGRGWNSLTSTVSPKKHEILINGVKSGEFSINHLETTGGYMGDSVYLGNYNGFPIWVKRPATYVPVDIILLIFSTNTSLIFDQTDIEPDYITYGGKNVKTVFINPSLLVSGDNTITIQTTFTDWPYYPTHMSAPWIQYFFRYAEDNVLTCQNDRICNDYSPLCEELLDVGGGKRAFTWTFSYNGDEYVECFVEPSVSISPSSSPSVSPSISPSPSSSTSPSSSPSISTDPSISPSSSPSVSINPSTSPSVSPSSSSSPSSSTSPSNSASFSPSISISSSASSSISPSSSPSISINPSTSPSVSSSASVSSSVSSSPSIDPP